MDADVNHTETNDDDEDNAGTLSISNDCHSEDDDALIGEENVLSAVYTKRTAVNKDESAEEFLLTCEAVVRFDQDFIADAINR
uniref:Uncharacterized protein n=1 Tax=Peronospora matthiolae TaxID=2874970 RepID=A0AAV1VPQ5_9STRA